MKSLRDAIKNLCDQYAIRRTDDPDAVITSLKKELDKRYKKSPIRDFIKDLTFKRNKIVISVTHPAVIQEMEGMKERIIKAVNDDLGEKLLLDIVFKIVPS
ncbi:DUF721 domain-containing protein [bacterium]|nr:DUF721 domain-containing protein [bacterium]MBU1024968.1 DUF721 domain-containing protein [bacterium]